MQLNSIPPSATPANLASSLASLQGITVGQQVPATVINSALAGQLVTLQLTDRQVQIHAEVALQQGQSLLLERLASSAATPLKILPQPANLAANSPITLQVGTQLSAEVVKLLTQQRLLVNLSGVLPANLPNQLEIDTRALPQNFRLGQALTLEVLRLQPLSVALKAPAQQTLTELTRQKLPQLLPQPVRFDALLQPFKAPQTQAIQQPVAQFLQTLNQPKNLQQAGPLQSALQQSGVFLEHGLANKTPVTLDLKANLLKLSSAVQSVISQHPQVQTALTQLPPEIRQALAHWLSTPEQRAPLPAQIQSALSGLGKSPTQMILQLLLGQGASPQALQTAQTFMPTAQQATQVTAAPFEAAELDRLRMLLREVESSVARLQLNQLTMLREPDNATTQQVWLMDVPIKDKQQLQWMQLQIEQRKAKQPDISEDNWQVTLKLETHSLGLIEAAIGLHVDAVNVTLTAESAATVEWLTKDIAVLQQKLADLNLRVDKLKCECAPVEWLSPDKNIATEAALVDIKV